MLAEGHLCMLAEGHLCMLAEGRLCVCWLNDFCVNVSQGGGPSSQDRKTSRNRE
jgi:hypothetical protein